MSKDSLFEIERESNEEAFGRDLGLVHELIIAARRRGGPDGVGRDFWKFLQESPAALTRAIEAAITFPKYPVKLDYPESMDKLIELVELGKYDVKCVLPSHITPVRVNKYVERGQTIEVSLYPVPRDAKPAELRKTLRGLKYRHANAAETLLLGIQYPDLQRAQPIVCLDGICGRYGNVDVIHLATNGRKARMIRTSIESETIDAGYMVPCVRVR